MKHNGTYAEKLIVIYDIVITLPDTTEGYVKSICSEVFIPLVNEITYVEKDLFTDEIVTTDAASQNNTGENK